jgi:hypothetical protein
MPSHRLVAEALLARVVQRPLDQQHRALAAAQAAVDGDEAAAEAHRRATAALAAAESAHPAAELEPRQRAAEELVRSGWLGEAAAELGRALLARSLRPAGSTSSRVALALGELRARIGGAGARPGPPPDFGAVDALWSLGLLSVFNEDVGRGLLILRQAALRAERAGESARLLALGAIRDSAPGIDAARAEGLVSEAEQAASGSHDSRAAAVCAVAKAVACWLGGRFRDALAACDAAAPTLAAAAPRATLEQALCRTVAAASLWYLGDLAELARRTDAERARAAADHDRFGQRLLECGHAAVYRLALDRSEELFADAVTIGASPIAGGLTLLDWLDLRVRGEQALYDGLPRHALEELTVLEPQLRAGRLFAVAATRFELLHLRGRAALLAAANDASLLDQAARDAEGLTTSGASWAEAMGHLLSAGVANAQGDAASALQRLERAEADAEKSGLALFAAVARLTRGRRKGGDEGRALVETAELGLAARGVVAPARLAAMLAPGF